LAEKSKPGSNVMPIEIRELIIRAVVTEGPSENRKLQTIMAQTKREVLEECREKLQELARRGNER
jgi:hypothetical protein